MVFIPLILLGVPFVPKLKRLLGKSDPGEIIWDEFTSIPLVFLGLPNSISRENTAEMIVLLILGFVLFRIFDIIKPLGIKKQHIGRGLGVMIDDVLAALYSAIALHLIFTFSLSFF